MKSLQNQPGPYKISQICVQHTDNHIGGIEFEYLCANGLKIERAHHIRDYWDCDIKEEFAKIGDNDAIYEISGKLSDDKIVYLRFKTYKGFQL